MMRNLLTHLDAIDESVLASLSLNAKKFSRKEMPSIQFQGTDHRVSLGGVYSLSDVLPRAVSDVLNQLVTADLTAPEVTQAVQDDRISIQMVRAEARKLQHLVSILKLLKETLPGLVAGEQKIPIETVYTRFFDINEHVKKIPQLKQAKKIAQLTSAAVTQGLEAGKGILLEDAGNEDVSKRQRSLREIKRALSEIERNPELSEERYPMVCELYRQARVALDPQAGLALHTSLVQADCHPDAIVAPPQQEAKADPDSAWSVDDIIEIERKKTVLNLYLQHLESQSGNGKPFGAKERAELKEKARLADGTNEDTLLLKKYRIVNDLLSSLNDNARPPSGRLASYNATFTPENRKILNERRDNIGMTLFKILATAGAAIFGVAPGIYVGYRLFGSKTRTQGGETVRELEERPAKRQRME